MSSELWRSLRRYKAEKRNKPLQRRPDEELDFMETTQTGSATKPATMPAKLLYDTTVYIDVLQGRFPSTGQLMLRAVEAWHSPVTEAELSAAIGLLDPARPNTRKVIEEIAAVIDQRPMRRTIAPDVFIWREAGILSGILARLQAYDKVQRRRTLNDALLFVTARRHGCTVLTRNLSDFDFLKQLDPAGRVMFYRVQGQA